MRWNDPFREMDALRREIDRAFAKFPFEGGNRARTAAFLPGRAARAYPLVNLSEDKDNLYVEALAPGLDPQTLQLSITHKQLTLSGEKPTVPDTAPEAYHRNERATGKFSRSLELPVEVDSERVEARYVDGILQITLPKAEVAKPRQISVSVN